MSKTFLVNFAGAPVSGYNAALREAQRVSNGSAPIGGITDSISWSAVTLRTTPFYGDNRNVLDRPRGGGYWLWKPYIILEALRGCGEDDVVVYWDVGRVRPNVFTRSVEPLVRWCKEHRGMLPGVPIVSQGRWTKRDCFHYMGCDSPRYWNARQIQATFSIWSGRAAREFVEEWLHWCRDRRCITDDPNECGLPNLPGFKEHRHDQSILTNLCVKHGVEALPALPVPAGAWSKDINIWSEVHADLEAEKSGAAANGFSLHRSLMNTAEGLAHARQLRDAGEFERAEVICRAAIAREAENAAALQLLGQLCLLNRRPREAIDVLRRAGALAPDLLIVQFDLAVALRLVGQFEESLETCEQARSVWPSNASLHAQRAHALAGIGRLAEAVDAYNRALSLHGVKSPERLYLQLGDAASRLGDQRQAAIAYRQALAINPQCGGASSKLATVSQRVDLSNSFLAPTDSTTAGGWVHAQ